MSLLGQRSSPPLPGTFLVLALLVGCAAPERLTSTAGYPVESGSSGIRGWRALATDRVVMQRHDYSCGAAALATLMTYYFGDTVSEREVLADVERVFDAQALDVILDRGLSFAELETLASSRGYETASVELQPDALSQLRGPVIVYLHTPRYRHFAVLRGVSDGVARLADPSRGNVSLPLDTFLDEWQGETLVLGKPGFGIPETFPMKWIDVDAPPLGHRRIVEPRAPSAWLHLPR